MKLHQAPEGWDLTGPGFLLGECENGYLWLPTWRWKGDAVVDGERQFGRAFNPWNPLHWPRWFNTRRRHALVHLSAF